ncbi:MAG: rRNA maturation RNase YbeY [Clostridia bacterium]|jgi:probable rRNA maturation factor|nr:rRNA maturation RNase YbeY [Clostridia bacterium]
MSVKVNITLRKKNANLPSGVRLLIRKACNATLKYEGFDDPCEIDVTLVNDEMIKEINNEFRGIDASTDVLSFPLGEKGNYDKNPATNALMLGDVVISLDHAFAQADLYGHGIEREIAFLTVHSVLHLLGYDHVNGGLEQAIMREKEEAVLDALGLAINKI